MTVELYARAPVARSSPGAATPRLEQMFAEQAALTPDAPAIFFRGQTVSYGELFAAVERLSRDLIKHGVGPGVLVGLSLQRTPGLIAAMLAILKAGGAYLPLDQRNPPERLNFMLSDSACALLLMDSASPAFEDFEGNVLELSDGQLIQRAYCKPPEPSAPADLAYLIYTSGSTGAPKGVMLGHGATHLVEWARHTYSSDDLARVAATTSICFDPSILEIFAPLCTGGALILKENALEPFSADEHPTLLDTVPSVLAELCRADALPRSLRVLIVGGEALSADLVRQVYSRRPSLELHNHYGPTEATTCATAATISRDVAGEPSIGRPVRGATIELLDGDGQSVAEGDTGEIYIGGPGLALGYLNRPELTAARFIDGPNGRLYRTGDLGFWRDGALYFAGRVDQQVKIRGFRVELGEIEAALARVAGVEKALVVVDKTPRRSQIIAYVQSQQRLTTARLRAALSAWLPDYMLPARIVILSAFPLLASGKVDRSQLPKPLDKPGRSTSAVSSMEKAIIHAFQDVLGRSSVGPLDSFFDLGGDSLASVQAALRLGEILGYDLPPALIHQAPTPRALASALEHGRVRSERHVNLLEPGGPAPPLFCMADLFGHAFNYLSLAKRLGGDRPIYGVTPGPLQDAFSRDRDVGALTQAFTQEVRALRPHGPYLIAGYSAGGMFAFDVACALEREGEEVRLILLDSYLHSRRPSMRTLMRWALKHVAGRSLTAAARGVGRLLRTLWRRMTGSTPPAWIPRSQVGFATSMIKAGAVFRPGRFSGPTLIVKATDQTPIDQLFDADRLHGWSDHLDGLVIQLGVPGGHHQFLREPLVSKTAAITKRFLSGLE